MPDHQEIPYSISENELKLMTLQRYPAMIITIPILLPIVESLGMSSLHFGVIIPINLLIGGVTPP